ncbi:SigE family RNA polymerase sigma factor [Actinoallomurus sp. NPDC052274]|uniref:SigE family RNA polymerase sigma factor n=1 Tax=Actinoallomurus sp. NPDC052274 TaxID=3155420 RepID=UPI003433F098
MNREARRQFTEFVTARTPSLLRLAYVLTGDRHAAEDLLQSALTKTAGRWGSVRDSPEAYVRKAMYHEQVGRWRSPRWRRESVTASVPDRSVADPSGQVDLRLALERALLALPPRRRAAIVLRYFEDLPEAEVAQVMGCSVGTVRSQTHRALARLRELVPDFAALAEDRAPETTRS